jgi:hypothetical protein
MIVLGSDVYDKVTVYVFFFCYNRQDIIKYKKSILPLICIVVKLTYFKK